MAFVFGAITPVLKPVSATQSRPCPSTYALAEPVLMRSVVPEFDGVVTLAAADCADSFAGLAPS